MPEKIMSENKIKTGWFGKLKIILLLFLIGFVLLAGFSAYYFYNQYSALKKVDPQALIQKESRSLVEKVGRLIVLPEGEEPTIATVSDPEKLVSQPFFAHAKTGYKVLIYTNSKKAILYDPVLDKIVEVAPLNIGSSGQ